MILEVYTELDMGYCTIDVLIEYKIVNHNGNKQAEFAEVHPVHNQYFQFCPGKMKEITNAAIIWISENSISLVEDSFDGL